MRNVVIGAYDQPRYNLAEYQQDVVADFSNEVALSCYRGIYE
jgi:hypothetical protein